MRLSFKARRVHSHVGRERVEETNARMSARKCLITFETRQVGKSVNYERVWDFKGLGVWVW